MTLPPRVDVDVLDEEVRAWMARMPESVDDYADRQARYDRRFPTYSLDTVGLPRAGPDVERRVVAALPPELAPAPLTGLLGKARARVEAENAARAPVYQANYDLVLQYLYLRLLYDPTFAFNVMVKGRDVLAETLPGSFRSIKDGDVWDRHPGWGPRKAAVLAIGKNPGRQEIDGHENFIGPTSADLTRALEELGLDTMAGAGSWYWTNAVKHVQLDPSGGALSAKHLENMLPVLGMELRLVRPDLVLCLGDDALKAVYRAVYGMRDRRAVKASVSGLFGRVETLKVPVHQVGGPPEHHAFRVAGCIHPARVHRAPDLYVDFVSALASFKALLAGERVGEVETDIEHVCIYTEAHLKAVVDRIVAETPARAVIAIDCEWHGNRPGEPGSYLRTIQFTHRAKHAYCVVLRHRGGRVAFRPGADAALAHLTRLFKSTATRKVRIGGHYLTADYPWLTHYGVDVGREYAVARTPERTRTHGGWDTHRMAHAYQEAMEGGYKLENLAARFCGVPRYDVKLQEWKDAYCARYKLKDKELGGYGECPDSILHDYALYDVDSTIRLFYKFNGDWDRANPIPGLLDADRHGNDCRRAFWLNHRPIRAILEMESTGVALDRDRGDAITDEFIRAYDILLGKFQERIGWADRIDPATGKVVAGGFNPNSHNQCKELLFGVDLNGVLDQETGRCRRQSPPDVALLDLMPIMSTGQRPTPWDRVLAQGKAGATGGMWPSVGKETLGILSHARGRDGEVTAAARTVGRLRDLKFLSQVLKGVLRRPWRDAAGRIARCGSTTAA
jgi:uracil-DNA glycosylase family 4